MGNMIGNIEDLNSLRYNYVKKKGISKTALGRHSTQIMKKRNSDLILSSARLKENNFNSKIYKDIFPPPNNTLLRNTISPIANLNQSSRSSSPDKLDLIKYNSMKIDHRIDILNNEENEYNVECEEIKPLVALNSLCQEENIELKNKDSNLPSDHFNFKKNSNEYELKYVKSGEDIRRSYIAKLIYKKVWQPTIKEKDHNSLIIFDWDDTLLCTSFLTPNGVFSEDNTRISEKDMEKIRKLEGNAATILKHAISKGDTYIITNAAPGWVEYSASRFYPDVVPLLKKVTIVSARGDYEKKFPGDSRQWKILAFLETMKNLDSNLVTNLVCLGDSIIEMEAAHILVSKFSQAFIKTIKFREAPKPEELNKQLCLVINQFDSIFSAVKNLTIRVEKKLKDEKPTHKSKLIQK